MGSEECEYERQLFGFSREELKAQLGAVVEETIRTNAARATEALIEALSAKGDSAKGVALELAGRKLEGIERLFSRNAEDSLRRLGAKIDERFEIPATVVLPEDRDMSSERQEKRLQSAKAETEKARRRALAAAAGARLLRRELKAVRDPHLAKINEAARNAADLLQSLPFPDAKTQT